MCTVTFLPLGERDFILTSSRDVSYKREKAAAPEIRVEGGVELLYPRDGKAGGTWIGSSSKKRLICLLNGGFQNHERMDTYRKSRGLIVTELLAAPSFRIAAEKIDLSGIEPFTLVVVSWRLRLALKEFVWDGELKHLRDLQLQPRIWSSATLFNDRMRQMREDWFSVWLKEQPPGHQEALDFHRKAGIGDPGVDVFLRRPHVGTVSITQFWKEGDKSKMQYQAFS
jgi:hypothetical protein